MLVVERTRRRYLLVGWLWFLGTLVPMIGMVQVGRQAMADRYAYLPLLGIFIMICWGVADWAEEKRLPSAVIAGRRRSSLCWRLAIVAHRQIGYWADNVTAVDTHHRSDGAELHRSRTISAGALLERKRLDEAIVHFRTGRRDPSGRSHQQFQHRLLRSTAWRSAEAISSTRRRSSLTTSPSLKIKALTNMGLAYRDLGDSDKARECFAAGQDNARSIILSGRGID